MVKSVNVKGKNVYALTMLTIHCQDFGLVDVYGITIIGADKTESIKDISSDYKSVYHLYKMIVEEELYTDHLYDVVEDFISGAFSKVIPLDLRHQNSVVA